MCTGNADAIAGNSSERNDPIHIDNICPIFNEESDGDENIEYEDIESDTEGEDIECISEDEIETTSGAF